MIQEDMEYMGPVRLRDVEDAQQKIVNVIKSLKKLAKLLFQGGGDEIIV